jgi:5-hydroxyisourate hydrolase-like protein (transthyretin family)
VIRLSIALTSLTTSLALVTALALAGSAAAVSQTQFPTFFTKFKYEKSSSSREFKGTIDSSKSTCVKGRKVKLIRKHNGNKKTLGADKTNSDGKFDIKLSNGQAKNGKYYAKATAKDFASGKKTCLSATSGSIKIS